MKYTSDLIEKIITSPSAKRGLDYITPIYGKAYVALWLTQAIGIQTDLIIKWIEEYKNQILPQTATWALSYFEEEYGIPVNNMLPIEERRKAVFLAIMARAPMNPAKLSDILSMSVNADVRIKENTGKNAFLAESKAYLDSYSIKKMKGIIDKYKPAHLIYWFNSYMSFNFFNKYDIFLRRLVLSAFFRNFESYFFEDSGDGSFVLIVKPKIINLCQLKMELGFEEKEELKTSVILDTMWCLDGEYNLDGERKLNAEIIREVIVD